MTAQRKILIIDDEPQIRRLLRFSLSENDYRVLEAANAADGLRMAATDAPDLILLDLGLPDMDGKDFILRVREWSRVPIVVISARLKDYEIAESLDRGADDYVTKPFSTVEVLARIRAALRHRVDEMSDTPVVRVGDLTVDLLEHIVTVAGREVKLTPKEFEILRVLITHAGKVVTHQLLLREVWGPHYLGETHYVRVYVGTLRQKIEKDPARPQYIKTESGVGYRLHDPR